MKKKGLIGRLTVLTLVLCLVTMSLTSGTLAKYASELSGNAVATVAKWAIKVTDDATTPTTLNSNFTLNLKDTAKETADLVAADTIAPDTKGAFGLVVDGTGTEVAFTYTIELDLSGAGLDKIPVKFYSDAACTTALTPVSNKITLTDDIMVSDTNKKSDQTIYWKWDSTNYSSTSDENTRDTEVGTASASSTLTYTIPVKITAEQKIS